MMPQIGAPLHTLMSNTSQIRTGSFYPGTNNPELFGTDSHAQRVHAQAFIWDNWPFISERFFPLLKRGAGPKNLLANLLRIERMREKLADKTGAALTRNLYSLIQFYLSDSDEEPFLSLQKAADECDPAESVLPLQRLAHAQVFRGQNDAALKSISELLRYAPEDRANMGLRGEIYFKTRQFDHSLECLERANPGEAELLKFVPIQVRLLDRSGRRERADLLMQGLAHESGWAANSITLLCRRDLPCQSRDELIQRLEPLAEFAGIYRPIHAQLGTLYQQAGQEKRAVAAYLKAIELKMMPPILLRSAQELAAKGGHAELEKLWARAGNRLLVFST